ncbi:hypothetical protein Pmar_PMAR015588 [Perkinsus marinus ATCC 50983]|uniref:Uncharacterized protein n=1 Tax=Perkinsus marinus (strain ATCC 50983 / TXsc) TaxID=423536 RepID=C5KUJ3_PERM5|nr:hypothetical protein Pmar_PMAR015588 [Perkinsus marinus ATCC 50983]EER11880.1 hypothetical protein Pmar_PMAR015588 [Perkinsus marinus ATCC 50983]|eukprot:XP_002780085.1 hypothetical protein Pmar_PMAR015588 [Perkinsus marinus ATCC 50983]
MGYGAGVLIHAEKGGLLVSVEGLDKDVADWTVVGIPLDSLVTVSLDEDNSECHVHIKQEALHVFADVRTNHIPRVLCDLPEPSKRRFVNIGPLQYNIPEVSRQCVRSLKLRNLGGPPSSISHERKGSSGSSEAIKAVRKSAHKSHSRRKHIDTASEPRREESRSEIYRPPGAHYRVVKVDIREVTEAVKSE